MQVEKEEGASEHGDATITSATSGPLEVWAQPAQIAVPNADRVAAGNSFLLLTHQGRVTGKVHHTVLEVVRYLVAGTLRHVWRLAEWRPLFPEARLWRARNTLLTLQKGRLPYTGILENAPPPDWSDDLDQLAFQGNPLGEEIVFFYRASGTVILDDLIQIHLPRKDHPLSKALLALSGVAAPHDGAPLDLRLPFTQRRLARHALDHLLSWDFDKLIFAHGPCIDHVAKPFVERAFQWLRRSA